ncbi:MAG TPA: enoyl-CoA hydratase-related protein [Dermatophilaceae bacterium]|nr:enoyl-CoA hydratase-related protein [Dermatophilaceae bacterium]
MTAPAAPDAHIGPTDPTSPEPTLVLERDGGIATVRFNRPAVFNALDRPTKTALVQALGEVAADPGVRCVVLTGTGRAFCVGEDLRAHTEALMWGAGDLASTVTEHYNPSAEQLATMPKPVIAAINGVAAGAGTSFAMAADFRIMAASGGMNLAFAGIGLSCDTGASFWLPRLVGVAKAKELLLLPRTVGAEECLALGLVTEVVPDDQLAGRVAELATRLAAGPTVAYGAMRRAIAYAAAHPLSDALAVERDFMQLTGDTQDHLDAVRAFVEKRSPEFHGR